MALMDKVLEVPSYGWQDASGEMVKPSKSEIIKEFFSRTNLFKSRKNWLAVVSWAWVICLIPALVTFIVYFFTWYFALAGVLYGAIFMSTHGTIWFHRYSTHRSYKFANNFWRLFTQNLVVKVVSEELYVVSHHVHHAKSDKPGDPYNAQGGFLYCFLADVNHQPIAKDLNETDYKGATKFLSHTGIYINSFAQYKRWGSISNPFHTLLITALNWAFWYGAFFLIAGHGLALALFSGAALWALAVRTFNYQGHGKGEDLRQEGVDYNWKDMSINQTRPGLLGGEWHNNHHLFPNSARAGFLKYQLDNAWNYIYLLYKIGAVSSYRDSKAEFLREYYIPNRKAENKRKHAAPKEIAKEKEEKLAG